MVWCHQFLVSISTSFPYVCHLRHCRLAANTMNIASDHSMLFETWQRYPRDQRLYVTNHNWFKPTSVVKSIRMLKWGFLFQQFRLSQAPCVCLGDIHQQPSVLTGNLSSCNWHFWRLAGNIIVNGWPFSHEFTCQRASITSTQTLWKVYWGQKLLQSNLNVVCGGIQNLCILRFSLKIGSICIQNFGFGACYIVLMKWPWNQWASITSS